MVNKKVSFKKTDKGKGKAPVHLAGKIRQPKGPKVQAAPKAAVKAKDTQVVCYYCQEPGHWKRDCKKHKEYLKKSGASTSSGTCIYVIELNLSLSTSDSWVLDTGAESHICVNVQVMEVRRALGKGEVDLRVGDGNKVSTTAVGTVSLRMPTGLVLILNNVHCVPTFCRNIISVSLLDREGYCFSIENGTFNIFKNNICYGNASLVGGLYILNSQDTNTSSIYNVNNKRFKSDDLNQTVIWHCRLGHIGEKRISTLHKCGLLSPFEFTSIERCESCLMGKMTKAPFTGSGERASDLLGLIHSDVCGPMSIQARRGFNYFITFTDDFSRFGYVYLMRHKSEAFDKFKDFKNEVQNQLGKSIKHFGLIGVGNT